jgi:hypothetical protein
MQTKGMRCGASGRQVQDLAVTFMPYSVSNVLSQRHDARAFFRRELALPKVYGRAPGGVQVNPTSGKIASEAQRLELMSTGRQCHALTYRCQTA